jgi:hypothetical protein
VVVMGMILLGPSGNIDPGGNVGTLGGYFDSNRISVTKAPISLSLASGGQSCRLALNGLRLGEPDLQYHILPFALIGTLFDE